MAKEGTKTYSFRHVPQDVYKIIIREQVKQKLARNRHISIEDVVYGLIREWEKCKEFEK